MRAALASTVRVTLVQFQVEPDAPDRNLDALKAAVREHHASDLVVFPELAIHGHALAAEPVRELQRAVHALDTARYEELRRWVAHERTPIIYGRIVEHDGRLYNVATFTDGAQEVDYAKTHVHWTEPFSPGDRFPVFNTPLGPTGMLICFDAAFPEVPRLLALGGAQCIVNLSAIPDSFDLAYVHRRLVASSIHNQVFTLFANRRGPGFRGGSAVVDPRGAIVAVADEHQSALTVELDPTDVDRWRTEEPVARHRRPDLYAPLTRL